MYARLFPNFFGVFLFAIFFICMPVHILSTVEVEKRRKKTTKTSKQMFSFRFNLQRFVCITLAKKMKKSHYSPTFTLLLSIYFSFLFSPPLCAFFFWSALSAASNIILVSFPLCVRSYPVVFFTYSVRFFVLSPVISVCLSMFFLYSSSSSNKLSCFVLSYPSLSHSEFDVIYFILYCACIFL